MSDPQDFSPHGNGFHPDSSSALQIDLAQRHREMVERQLRKRGIRNERVLTAMLAVPRHEFIPADLLAQAYYDRPLAIGHGQTISQPFMVAAIAEALGLAGAERVLEVGAGSGYQAAVLSLLACEVHAVETHEDLAVATRQRLQRLGYANVRVHIGDGTLGWPEAAPFEAILVTAAAPEIPPPFAAQLTEGGRLVIPVGGQQDQRLVRAQKHGESLSTRALYHCRFVPLVGKYGWKQQTG
jgi:protein-L-isoaspartate(D-aspartate) O-methyltransferase